MCIAKFWILCIPVVKMCRHTFQYLWSSLFRGRIYFGRSPEVRYCNNQHAHRFFHLGVHVPFYLHFWGYIQIFGGAISNSSFGGTKKINCIFSTQGRAPCCFFVNITQSWRKLFFSVWHWVRQEVGFCLTHGLCVCPTIFFVILYITCQILFFIQNWMQDYLYIVMIIKQLN